MRSHDCFMRLLPNARLRCIVEDGSGQTMVEYVLVLLLIALVVILAVPAVADGISEAFAKIAAAFEH